MEPAYNALLSFHTLGVFIRQMWWNIKINLLEKKTIGKQKNSLRYIFYKTCI